MDEMMQRYIDGNCPLCGAENATEVLFYEGYDEPTFTVILKCHECKKHSQAVYALQSVAPRPIIGGM